MSLYELDTDYIGEQLLPPKLRKVKALAWLKVLLKPLSNLFNIDFKDYTLGAIYDPYDVLTNYPFGERVIWTDKRVYESLTSSNLGNLPSDSAKWLLCQNIFIGVDERVKYNSQKILFEFALNKFFMVDPFPADQIYITNNFVNASTNFVMGLMSSSSSVMPLNSVNQIDYMGLSPVYVTDIYDYTINVPTAVFTGLGDNTSNREQAIRNFADLYNLSGMQYNVITY